MQPVITNTVWHKFTANQMECIKMQATATNVKPKHMRYTGSQKQLALIILFNNYESLRSVCTLPLRNTFAAYINKAKLTTGINKVLINLLSCKLKDCNHDKKYMLTFDGMHIAQSLEYKSDIAGFTDLGNGK